MKTGRLAAHRPSGGQRPPASSLQAGPEFHGIPPPAAQRTSCKTFITIGSSHAPSPVGSKNKVVKIYLREFHSRVGGATERLHLILKTSSTSYWDPTPR